MRKLFKILILIIAILPLWLTVIAMASEEGHLETWRLKLNAELLRLKDQKIQLIEIFEMTGGLNDEDRKHEFRIDLSRVNPKGPSTLGLTIIDSKGRLLKYSEVKARLLVQWQVPVALASLKKGDRITDQSFEWKWVDASALSRSPVRTVSPAGKAVRAYIPANQVIYHHQIEDGQNVRRGARVKITAVSPGIRISTVGVARENGNLGDTIRVLNLDSKKELLGVITTNEDVEVYL
jgi:flagella basal body P-ring formation protein FlgA